MTIHIEKSNTVTSVTFENGKIIYKNTNGDLEFLVKILAMLNEK